MLYSRSLFISFIYSGVYLLIPSCKFIPPLYKFLASIQSFLFFSFFLLPPLLSFRLSSPLSFFL